LKLTLLQSRGANSAAASSAAVESPGAVPVATASGVAPLSCAACVEPCWLVPGNGVSASTIHSGITSVDAGYATPVASAITAVATAVLRRIPK
jgi:hypothetical protein